MSIFALDGLMECIILPLKTKSSFPPIDMMAFYVSLGLFLAFLIQNDNFMFRIINDSIRFVHGQQLG